MTVRLTQPVLGQQVNYAYTGPLEAWLLNEGYAVASAAVPNAWAEDADGILGAVKPTVTVTPTAAVLTASANADATVGADGDIVFGTEGGVRTTASLLTADTAAQAATKIDTALTGLANAAITSSKLTVTSVATGPTAYVAVVDGTAAVLDALGVAVGDEAWGGDGRPAGASNTGVQADVPENDPKAPENREAPYWPATPDQNATIANDADNLTETSFPNTRFDYDADDTDTEAPSNVTLDPAEGPEEGGTVVRIFGDNLEGVTAVTFGGVAGTDFVDDYADEGLLIVTTPAGTAGAQDVILDDGSTDTTLTDGFEYLATP